MTNNITTLTTQSHLIDSNGSDPLHEPTIIVYEPSFEGWLSAVFYVYEHKYHHNPYLKLVNSSDYTPSLIDTAVYAPLDEAKSARVLKKLHDVLGRSGIRQMLWGFLSEKEEIGTTLFKILKYAINFPHRQVLQDLGNLEVLELAQTVKSVGREKHRMEAFVRFEHTSEDIYFARIEPDFNVLPLIGEHFRQRYQDQNWAIYDIKRGYGIYYNMSLASDKKPAPLQAITDVDHAVVNNPASIHSEQEQQYQRFWQGYFANVNIKERKNNRLHKQYLPQRYWKYLSEKQALPNAEHLAKKR